MRNEKEIQLISSKLDHTNLNKNAEKTDIIALCSVAKYYKTASVCVAPYYVALAKDCLKNSDVKVCTVIGFPNGYSTIEVKLFETKEAIKNGASEIDMVLNNCMLANEEYHDIIFEIRSIADYCHSTNAILKVIIETCLLTKEQIRMMCELCIEGGADFIKTSTGFDKEGAKLSDIVFMKECIGNRHLKIKASGGIRSADDALNFINAGADRIGASKVLADIKE